MSYNNPRDVIKKEDSLLTYYFAGQISFLIAKMATKIKWLSPNFFTTISFISGIITAWLFANNQLIVGSLLLLITLIFDCVDGQLARLISKQSKLGEWYDHYTDKIKDVLILFGLAWGAYQINHECLVYVFAFFALSFQYLRNMSRYWRESFELKYKAQISEKVIIKKIPCQFIRSLKHTLLFKEADRYGLIIIFALLNQVSLLLVMYAIIQFIYTCFSIYLNYKQFKQYDTSKQ
ncbi:MAG: CDP-alcohol phosphatidyltransferase family protein [Patescibacteria group bacterium]